MYFEKIIKELGFPEKEINRIDMVFTAIAGETTLSIEKFESKEFCLWILYNKKYVHLIFETERKNRKRLIKVIKKFCSFPPKKSLSVK
jgi:hypothetical protein